MAQGWAFHALGVPAPQGSKRHVGGGRMVESSKALPAWRDTLVSAAVGAGEMLHGPLICKVVFTVPRPKSAPKREHAPKRGIDLDKLLRALGDAITIAGLWEDDRQLCDLVRVAKVWTQYDPEALPVPGVIVACTTISPWVNEDDATTVRRLFTTERLAAWERFRE